MSCKILVYKQGDSATIRGVKCDFKRIELSELQKYLSAGYVKSVDDLKKLASQKKIKKA